MRFADGEEGFVELETGALIADRAVQTVAKERGAPLVIARAEPPRRQSDGRYRVADGVIAAHVVSACGPWPGKLFPDVLGGRIVPTRQEIRHFGGSQERRVGRECVRTRRSRWLSDQYNTKKERN